jgi:hypothetical protein
VSCIHQGRGNRGRLQINDVKKSYNAKRMKDEGEPLWLSFKCTQVVSTACLFEILVRHYFYTVLLDLEGLGTFKEHQGEPLIHLIQVQEEPN